MPQPTVNCATCGALVYAIHVPSKKTGNCWTCEIKRLQNALSHIAKTCIEDPDTAQFACRVISGDAGIAEPPKRKRVKRVKD